MAIITASRMAYKPLKPLEGITWLEKAEATGKVTLEDIGDALEEFARLFKAGIASKAETLTLARAFPDNGEYTRIVMQVYNERTGYWEEYAYFLSPNGLIDDDMNIETEFKEGDFIKGETLFNIVQIGNKITKKQAVNELPEGVTSATWDRKPKKEGGINSIWADPEEKREYNKRKEENEKLRLRKQLYGG